MIGPLRTGPRMRVTEYREWVAPLPDEERWELLDGEPTLMPPPSERHQRIVGNLLVGLGELAKRRGGFAYPDLAVSSAATEDWAPRPDIVIGNSVEDEYGSTGDPMLIAEVVAPSGFIIDRGFKMEFYRTLLSLQLVLLVYQEEVRVEVWRPEADWTSMRVVRPGEPIDLPELGGAPSPWPMSTTGSIFESLVDRFIRPNPLILRCRASGLEGGLQESRDPLEPSFEAPLRAAPQDEGEGLDQSQNRGAPASKSEVEQAEHRRPHWRPSDRMLASTGSSGGPAMTVAVRRDTRMRVAAYREWAATRPDDERWELLDGEPVMKSPAGGRHQRIVTNIVKRLDDLAERRGCGAYPGLAILSEARDDDAPIPDVVVQCGEPPADGYTGDPLLVVEVLSPSTFLIDRGRKTEFYQTVPSLRFLLLVQQDEVQVEVWRREAAWTMRIAGPGETIDLPELGGSLSVAEIYAHLSL